MQLKRSAALSRPVQILLATLVAALLVGGTSTPANAGKPNRAGKTGPSVQFLAPTTGATVEGQLGPDSPTCEVTGTNIVRVQFYLDGSPLNAEYSSPWQCAWDTTKTSDGTHTLKAVAYDSSERSASTQVDVTVANGSVLEPEPELEPPTSSVFTVARLATFDSDWPPISTPNIIEPENISGTIGFYQGRQAARVAFNGAPTSRNPAARSHFRVDWEPGSDVWYGGDFFVPDLSKLQWTDLLRWDNYLTYGSNGDVGGFQVREGGQGMLWHAYYGGTGTELVKFTVPEGRWFRFDVRQVLSGNAGEALTVVYIDGQEVGRSTNHNSYGRIINHLRYGYVSHYTAEGTIGASDLYFDDARLSTPAP